MPTWRLHQDPLANPKPLKALMAPCLISLTGIFEHLTLASLTDIPCSLV